MRRRWTTSLSLATLGAGLALGSAPSTLLAQALASGGRSAPAIDALPIARWVLPNGLTVVVHEDRSHPIVAIELAYHVGSRHDPAGRSGMAHLAEHIMGAGSAAVPPGEYRRLASEAGGSSFATTHEDYTRYGATVPRNYLETLLWVEAERMRAAPTVATQDGLDTERVDLLNERAQRMIALGATVNEATTAGLFPAGHPYHRSSMGIPADLDAVTVAEVRAFLSTYYRPDRATLVIAGDVRPVEVRALVGRLFGGIPRGLRPAPPPPVFAPPVAERRAVLQDRRVRTPQIRLAWAGAPTGHRDVAPLRTLAAWLAGDRNAVLPRALIDDLRLASAVQMRHAELERAGILEITVTARDSTVSLTAIEHALDSLLVGARAAAPDAAALAVTQRAFATRTVLALQTDSARAEYLADGEVFQDDPRAAFATAERIRRIPAAEVLRVARKYLVPGRMVLSVVGAGRESLASQPDRPSVAMAAVAGDTARRVVPTTMRLDLPNGAASRPRPGPLPAFRAPHARVETLTNGLTLVIVENHETPIVAVRAAIDLPVGSDPVGREGLGAILTAMLREGTTTHTAAQLADAYAATGMVMRANGFSGRAEGFDDAMALLADMLRRPALDSAAVVRLRDAQRTATAGPDRQAPRAFNQIHFGTDHPFGRLPTPASVGAITHGDVVQAHRAFVHPANVALVIVGDVNPQQVIATARRHFGDWPHTGARAAAADAPPPPTRPTTIYLVDRPLEDSWMYLGQTGPARGDDQPVYDALGVIYGALGSSRLGNALQRPSLAYSTLSTWLWRREGELSTLMGAARFAPDRTVAGLTTWLRELREIGSTRPPTDAELAFARSNRAAQILVRMETVDAVADRFADYWIGGQGFDYPERYVRTIAGLERADLLRVAATMDPSATTIVIVGDAARIEAPLRAAGLAPVVVVDERGNRIR